jgi:broad specificity phosphatase PhoE
LVADRSLCLVRHGETEWSRAGRHTGRTDLPLTPEGETLAANELRAALVGRPFMAVFSSPMERARRTAELAGFPDAELTPLLLEYDYGDYEGLTTDEIHQQRPGWELFHDGCPNGETPADVYARARAFCDLASLTDGDVLAFCHGHISRAVTAAFLAWPIELAADFRNLDVGRLGILTEGNRGRLLGYWNAAD